MERNLFHSFEQFSVPTGSTAYFNNAPEIQNIISRVTGDFISKIDGLIRANGTANLFLLNPKGIIFGPNARLDIGGSFVASTADSVVFDNGFAFGAVNPQVSPLLTIKVPLGLQFGANPGSIVNQSVEGLEVQSGRTLALVGGDVRLEGGILHAPGGRVELGGVAGEKRVGLNIDRNNLNLSFPDGVALADVWIANRAEVDVMAGDGGSIAINARNIDVLEGSSLRAGIGLLLGAAGAQAGDVTLSAEKTVRVENSSIYNSVFGSGNGGSLRVDTGKLIVRDGVVATATVSQGHGGELIVNARDSVELTGSPSSNGTVPTNISVRIFGSSLDIPALLPIGLFSVSINPEDIFRNFGILDNLLVGSGNAGKLIVETGRLIVQDGAIVAGGTTSAGNAGDLIVKADFIEISGIAFNEVPSDFFLTSLVNPINRISSGLINASADSNSGASGKLTIETGRLVIRNGARVGTNSFSRGLAGEVAVNAKESVELSGVSSVNGIPGDPSYLVSLNRGTEGVDSLTINTKRLIVRDGAIISAGTTGSGNGGALTINASESVELIGTSTERLLASILQGLFGTPASTVFDEGPLPSGVITGTTGEGDAGSLNINTERLVIQGGAQASVFTVGAGDAGSLTVDASSVELTGTSQQSNPNDIVGRSLLTAAVGADSTGNGGNITVKANSLTITDGAALTASISGQGNEGGNIDLQVRDLILMRRNSLISAKADNNSNSGNIDIDASFIVAVPNENSDIVANAVGGRGGNINITTQGIYGLEYREKLTPLSEINASSQFGVNGTVQINTPDVDPSGGVANLPEAPVPEEEISQGCLADKENSFTVTGRGGLPQQPGEALRTEAVRVNGETLNTGVENRSTEGTSTPPNSPTPAPLVEAQGWVVNAQGQVVLTASAPTVTPNSSWLNSISCHARQKSY